MGMLASLVHIHVVKYLPSKPVLREHAAYGTLHQDGGRLATHHFTGSGGATATWVACVMLQYFIIPLLAGHFDLVGIDDDDIVPTIDVRREAGLMLATEYFGDIAGHPAEHC